MPQVEPVPDTPEDRHPDTVSTPEGDNEFAPDQPLRPSIIESTVDGLKTPRGSQTTPYYEDKENADKEEEAKPTGFLKVLDEISTGKLQP